MQWYNNKLLNQTHICHLPTSIPNTFCILPKSTVIICEPLGYKEFYSDEHSRPIMTHPALVVIQANPNPAGWTLHGSALTCCSLQNKTNRDQLSVRGLQKTHWSVDAAFHPASLFKTDYSRSIPVSGRNPKRQRQRKHWIAKYSEQFKIYHHELERAKTFFSWIFASRSQKKK